MTRSTRLFPLALMIVVGILASAACRREDNRAENATQSASREAVVLSAETMSISGVKVVKAERRSLAVPIRAAGVIEFNKRRLVCLTPRIPGRIEAVYVFEGDRVKENQRMLALFSPDYLSAQQELIQLLMQRDRAAESGDKEAETLASNLIRSTGHKIKLMGATDEDIQITQDTRELQDYLFIAAPFSGSVVAAAAIAGDYVEIGRELFQLADLSSLWATVNIFEKDLTLVKPGAEGEIRIQAYPGVTFKGRLAVLGDVVDAETRTVKGRLEVPNPALKLKPGMFADVTLGSARAAEALVIPEKAVRNVEGRNVVFVPGAAGSFVPREVRLGRVFDGWVEILEGLEDGDEVAAEGSFALKAELLKKTLEGEEE
jgi:Cu(I)/Ag(I) efflux system membrane fusion protein